MPAMHDEIITPKILCRHTRIIVSGHFSVVCLEPYLQLKKNPVRYLTCLHIRTHFAIYKGGSVEETVLVFVRETTEFLAAKNCTGTGSTEKDTS